MSLPLSYTQNFLHNEALVAELVQKAQIRTGETVLEIGPGKGIITRELARVVGEKGSVIAVELDEKLAHALQQHFQSTKNVTIRHQDFLAFDLGSLPSYTVFANVPFAISSLILEKLFHPLHGPQMAFLILQTESLVSQHGSRTQSSFKSLLLEPFYMVSKLHTFRPQDFSPAPSVSTTLFAFRKRSQSLFPADLEPLWKDFLANIAQDRVGEGSWKRLFLSRELQQVIKQTGLIKGKGIRAQQLAALVQVFQTYIVPSSARKQQLTGSFARLRTQQAETSRKNEREGHKPAQR